MDEELIAAFLAGRMDTTVARTRATYRAYLVHYARWVAQGDADPWAPATLRAYIAGRTTDSNTTLRSRVRYLRLFCNWLLDVEVLARSPFVGRDKVRMPAKKRTRRVVYTRAEVVALLQATGPTQWKRGPRATIRVQWSADGPMARDAAQGRALVLLLVDSALRAGEAAAITCGEVRTAPAAVGMHGPGRTYKLPVRSKGGHLDVAFVSSETRAALVALAGERPDEEPLFRDWNNRPATVRGLRGILQRLARRAGVTLPPRPLHAFRHYAARQWLKAKLPDLVIRQLMRHESLSTTQIYTELEDDELAELHAEASPIASLIALAGVAAA